MLNPVGEAVPAELVTGIRVGDGRITSLSDPHVPRTGVFNRRG